MISPVVLVILGIILAFIGKKLLRIMVMLGGGVAFAYFTYMYSGNLGLEGTAVYVATLLAFIVGMFLAWFLVKLVLSLAIGFVLGMILTSILGLSGNIYAMVLMILLSIVIAYILAEKIVFIALTLLGVAIFYLGLSALLEGTIGGFMATAMSLVISFILFIIVAIYHLKKR